MGRHAFVILLLLIAPLLVEAQSGPPSAPEMQYEFVPNFLKLPPHQYLGEAAGVAVNSKGHIFVYSRSDHTQLLEFGPDGKFIRLIGDNLWGFSYAHSARVDKNDNIWTVDEGGNVVVKFNPEGGVEMVLGRKVASTVNPNPGAPPPAGEASPESPDARAYFDLRLYRPTDVAFGLNGEIYVSDGYGHSRIMKYDQYGNFIKEWGKKGTGPGEFRLPHFVATDAKGNVYVSDAGNRRIQIFDADGKFLKEWTQVASRGLCITPPPKQVLFVSTSGPFYKMDLDGNILGVISHPGKGLTEIHGIACPSENLLFLGDVQNWRVEKMILHPTTR